MLHPGYICTVYHTLNICVHVLVLSFYRVCIILVYKDNLICTAICTVTYVCTIKYYRYMGMILYALLYVRWYVTVCMFDLICTYMCTYHILGMV
jgi:hypothetical protein